jgi:hypothetical protein
MADEFAECLDSPGKRQHRQPPSIARTSNCRHRGCMFRDIGITDWSLNPAIGFPTMHLRGRGNAPLKSSGGNYGRSRSPRTCTPIPMKETVTAVGGDGGGELIACMNRIDLHFGFLQAGGLGPLARSHHSNPHWIHLIFVIEERALVARKKRRTTNRTVVRPRVGAKTWASGIRYFGSRAQATQQI